MLTFKEYTFHKKTVQIHITNDRETVIANSEIESLLQDVIDVYENDNTFSHSDYTEATPNKETVSIYINVFPDVHTYRVGCCMWQDTNRFFIETYKSKSETEINAKDMLIDTLVHEFIHALDRNIGRPFDRPKTFCDLTDDKVLAYYITSISEYRALYFSAKFSTWGKETLKQVHALTKTHDAVEEKASANIFQTLVNPIKNYFLANDVADKLDWTDLGQLNYGAFRFNLLIRNEQHSIISMTEIEQVIEDVFVEHWQETRFDSQNWIESEIPKRRKYTLYIQLRNTTHKDCLGCMQKHNKKAFAVWVYRTKYESHYNKEEIKDIAIDTIAHEIAHVLDMLIGRPFEEPYSRNSVKQLDTHHNYYTTSISEFRALHLSANFSEYGARKLNKIYQYINGVEV